MKALWLENRKLIYREDIARPRRRPGETLVRVLQAGICNTDLEILLGYYPFAGIPGHEFVGVVEEGTGSLVGQRVVGEINISCDDCPECRRGDRTHCSNRRVLGIKGRDGAFAEYLSLPEENLHPIPDSISTDAATFVEPLAAALRIQEQVPVRRADRVVIIGDGKLGQLIAQTIALTKCHLLVAGRRARKLDLLSSRNIPIGLVDEIEPGSFDIAIECTGNRDGFESALRSLRPRGTLVMKSTYAGRLTLDASALVVNEITVVGSRCGPFRRALRHLADHLVDVEPLIDTRFSISEGPAAFEFARRPGILKVILEIAKDGSPEC